MTHGLRGVMEIFATGGNRWLAGRDFMETYGFNQNVYVHIARLADVLETRPDPENGHRSQHRLRPKVYSEICQNHGIIPSPEGTAPFSLSAHLRQHNPSSIIGYDSSPGFGDGDIIWEEG